MSVEQRYRDIRPVTLQVGGGALSSSLYCAEVEGLSGEVEAFLVELFRCKLCQFTCSLRTSISNHVLRHRPLAFGGGVEEEAESPYRLHLHGESKQSEEDEEFLLYNMLDNMSPPTCDMSAEAGLQVAHTCEVTTLFEGEEEEHEEGAEPIFPPKDDSMDLSCPTVSASSQEETAQSAHLMTLGLCRISAGRPPPPPPPPPLPSSASSRLAQIPSPRDSASQTDGPQPGTCTPCPQAPPAIGDELWTADSWEEPEPSWRRLDRRRTRRSPDEEEEKKKKKKKKKKKGGTVCPKKSNNMASPTNGCFSDGWRKKKVEPMDRMTSGSRSDATPSVVVPSQTSRSQTGSLQKATKKKKKPRRKKREEEEEEAEQTTFCCSLCTRKFSSKLTLRRHLGVHGGAKPFSCPQCPYSSRLKASLLQHLRTHTGEKPYRCALCPYASIDRSSLLRHTRTHSREKPYRCQHCDYSSIQKKSLDLHARRHHTGEAFPCRQCEYSSPDRQLLLRHVRRHHAPTHVPPL